MQCLKIACIESPDILYIHFSGRSDVRWHDPSGLFAKYKKSIEDQKLTELNRVVLKGIYWDMEHFFTHGARVEKQPTLTEQMKLIKHITDTKTVQNALPDILLVSKAMQYFEKYVYLIII